jgi:hypothetical protein
LANATDPTFDKAIAALNDTYCACLYQSKIAFDTAIGNAKANKKHQKQ